MFKRTARFKVVKPPEIQRAIMQRLPDGSEEQPSPEPQIPEELKPLAEKWRETLKAMADARFTPAITIDGKAFYVLQSLPLAFDNKTSISTVTLRAIDEDLRVCEITQRIHMNKYGIVQILGVEIQPIQKPSEFGITAEAVIQIVKSVIQGSTLLPAEVGIK